jgi:hypothetical protein
LLQDGEARRTKPRYLSLESELFYSPVCPAVT